MGNAYFQHISNMTHLHAITSTHQLSTKNFKCILIIYIHFPYFNSMTHLYAITMTRKA